MRTSYSLVAILLLSLAISLPAAAQENFNQTISLSDGSFTARIPSDWTWAEGEGALIVADTEATLIRLSNGENPQPGDMALALFGPQFIEAELGATPDSDLNTLAEALIGELQGEVVPVFEAGEIVTLDDGRKAIIAQSLPSSAIGGGYIIIDHGDGRFIAALAIATPEDIQQYGATMAAIVLTVTLASAEATPVALESDPERYEQWAISANGSSQYGSVDWSAIQATGAPDTKGCGDHGTAWASLESTGEEVLTLTYPEPVTPAQVNIHQTYTPGSIIKVELVAEESGRVIELANSADPPGNTACPGVFSLNITEKLPFVNQVIIHLDQSIAGGRNEIDAVQLVGKPRREMGIQQWAIEASASSEYGNPSWSAAQATGMPNTKSCGDTTSAWASSSSVGQDRLNVFYTQAVIPTQVNIHQTYTPGSIVKVELVEAESGRVVELPNSADPPGHTVCPGAFTLNITDTLPPVNQVIIHLDQSIGGNWNEIDAVQLIGRP